MVFSNKTITPVHEVKVTEDGVKQSNQFCYVGGIRFRNQESNSYMAKTTFNLMKHLLTK